MNDGAPVQSSTLTITLTITLTLPLTRIHSIHEEDLTPRKKPKVSFSEGLELQDHDAGRGSSRKVELNLQFTEKGVVHYTNVHGTEFGADVRSKKVAEALKKIYPYGITSLRQVGYTVQCVLYENEKGFSAATFISSEFLPCPAPCVAFNGKF